MARPGRAAPRTRALALVVGGVVVLAVFGALECAVRLVGLDAGEWPVTDDIGQRPGVRTDWLLGSTLEPGFAGPFEGVDPGAADVRSLAFDVRADAAGFRVARDAPTAPDRARIVALVGDSVTFGWGVAGEETFAARLQARDAALHAPDARTRIVNAGFPGRSAVVGRYVVREQVLPLEPEVVVIGFSANNAFRLTIRPDRERFRHARIRAFAHQSQLLRTLSAALARARAGGVSVDPRSRSGIQTSDWSQLSRVAPIDDFERATLQMLDDVERAGASALLLVVPRASQIEERGIAEDAARLGASASRRSRVQQRGYFRGLLEVSCLEPMPGVETALVREAPAWHPLRPREPAIAALLREGAKAFGDRDLVAARRAFEAALALDGDDPLALYDLAATEIEAGNVDEGIALLDRADASACSAFVRYQTRLRAIAARRSVPVADLLIAFQAHDEPGLMLDTAHFSARGHAVAAEVLWRALFADRPDAVP